MAEDDAGVTEQVFEPSPERAQAALGEHFPWLFTFFGEDVLEVTSWNSAAGVRLRISGRVHASPGVIVPFSATHVPNTDRSAAMTVITMPIGELLNAIVWAETGSPQAGQTFVRIAVRRGAGAAFERLGVIIQGAVTANAARAFPGSPVQSPLDVEPYLRTIAGTTPAAAAVISETVPTSVRWELLNWNFQFATSALAANRVHYLNALLAGAIVSSVVHNDTIPGSAIYFCVYAPNLVYLTDRNNGKTQSPMPQRLVLTAGAVLSTGAIGMLAGDQFSSITYTVREWLDV